jgi:alpha-tubulin suppressor-like RCC1 family protein
MSYIYLTCPFPFYDSNDYVFADDGKIINWGRNTYGQLGCHEYQRPLSWKPQIMENIENVTQLAVGSEHNIAILGIFELFLHSMLIYIY